MTDRLTESIARLEAEPTVTVEEATLATCIAVARRRLVAALRELDGDDSHTADHIRMYINDALRWLTDNPEPKHEARKPHPLTMAGR